MAGAVNKFVGQGLVFPIEINAKGAAVTKSGFELIKSSIFTLLSWPKFNRFYEERFGCRIWEVLEEPNDLIAITLAESFIKESIEQYEKRIEVLEVSVITETQTESRLEISIDVRIKNSDIRESFIYPFYKPN